MSPDFEYLLRLSQGTHFSHTLVGVLAFCMPLSLATWLFFHRLMLPAFIDLLPSGVRKEWPFAAPHLRASTIGWAVLATFGGASSHVVWDAFTHEYGFGVVAMPELRTLALSTAGLRWYQVLQHGSSVFGLVVLGLWARRGWHGFSPHARRFTRAEAERAWRVAAVLFAASTFAAVLDGARAWGSPPLHVIAFAAIGAMDGFVVSAVALSLFIRLSPVRSSPALVEVDDADRTTHAARDMRPEGTRPRA